MAAVSQLLSSNGLDVSQQPYVFGGDYTLNDVPLSQVNSVTQQLRGRALDDAVKFAANINNADASKLVADPHNTLGGASIIISPIYIDREATEITIDKNISLPLLSGKTFVGNQTEEHGISKIRFTSENKATITTTEGDTEYTVERKTLTIHILKGDVNVMTFGFKSAAQLTLTRLNDTSVTSKKYLFDLAQ